MAKPTTTPASLIDKYGFLDSTASPIVHVGHPPSGLGARAQERLQRELHLLARVQRMLAHT
jgi:hypothetical protein